MVHHHYLTVIRYIINGNTIDLISCDGCGYKSWSFTEAPQNG